MHILRNRPLAGQKMGRQLRCAQAAYQRFNLSRQPANFVNILLAFLGGHNGFPCYWGIGYWVLDIE
jgi:hypothetical protein